MRWPALLRERFFFMVFLEVSALALSGCVQSSYLPRFGPAGDALRYAFGPAETPRLQAGYDYLRVDVNGRQTVMVRAPSDSAAPSEEYWYSAQSEMMHLRHGRLWRVLGMTTEWRDQVSSPPAWNQLAGTNESATWVRQVNRMPGYRWRETDQIESRHLSQAPNIPQASQWPVALWFEEDIQSLDGAGQRWRFKQRFAINEGQVVFSEQCIAPDLCLQLTRLKHSP